MQDSSHLLIDEEKILVLRRSTKYGVTLKIRHSGKDGLLLGDESKYLEGDSSKLDQLKQGLVVCL